jgi:penicillin-binding protein 1A
MPVRLRRFLIASAALAVGAALLFYPYYGHAPCDVSARVQALRGGTELFDAQGRRLGWMDQSRERFRPLTTLPAHVATAFVAVEDRRLYRWYHRGVDPVGTVGAFVHKPGDDTRRGASTIPMQLARSLCGDHMPKDHRWAGKLAEAGLSVYLTSVMDKRTMVELYLNSVYLGRNRHGVEAAARSYFGKSAPNLTASDAAELAHLVANPRDRDPATRSVDVRRQAIRGVFVKMARYDRKPVNARGRITPSRTRLAAAVTPVYRGYISRVRDGFTNCEPGRTCPSRVNTFLEADLQRSAERELGALVQRLQGPARAASSKGAATPPREVAGIFVAMRVSTGEVVAYTGRHGRTRVGAADLLRIGRIQPASTLKPLLLAAAIDDQDVSVDASIGELLSDHCPQPQVQEYLATLSGTDAPDRTVIEAMYRSDNVLGACLLAGLSRGARQRLVTSGLLREVNAPPSDGLGVQTVAPLDLLTGYAALRMGPQTPLPRFSPYDPQRFSVPMVSSDAAETTYEALQGVAREGTAWRAASLLSDDWSLAGKTGTAGGGRELVFVGFARDLVALIWVGVVSGNGAVSQKHASDVVVEPWARIMRSYAPRDMWMHEREPEPEPAERIVSDAGELLRAELKRWIADVAARSERGTI